MSQGVTRAAWQKAWRAAALQYRPAIRLEPHVYGIQSSGSWWGPDSHWWMVDLRVADDPHCDCPAANFGTDRICKHIVYFQFVEWCLREYASSRPRGKAR